MEKVKVKASKLEREWELLINEARKIGLTTEEVRNFLLEGSHRNSPA